METKLQTFEYKNCTLVYRSLSIAWCSGGTPSQIRCKGIGVRFELLCLSASRPGRFVLHVAFYPSSSVIPCPVAQLTESVFFLLVGTFRLLSEKRLPSEASEALSLAASQHAEGAVSNPSCAKCSTAHLSIDREAWVYNISRFLHLQATLIERDP